MPSDYSRIHRLLKIVTLIQSEPGYGPRRLAQECNSTERSIYRDLKTIQAAGIPCYFDREKNGYFIRADFFMPAVSLTLEESLALVVLAEHVAGKGQFPYLGPAAKAIAKIRCNLPTPIQKELETVDTNLAVRLPPMSKADQIKDVYEKVRVALGRRVRLICEYQSVASGMGNDHGSEPFLFEPYSLLFSKRAWYAIGHHGGRKEVRCLKLNRFARCQFTDQEYKIPKSFSVDKHLGNAWQMIRGKPSYEVELWFSPEFAETIEDTHWHKTQEVIWQEDNSILFRCTVDGLEEIVWWILSMGPHCIVKQPKELADRVKHLGRQMLDRYPDKG